MKLVADSGSTKTDWRLINEEGNLAASFDTLGLNPFFHTKEGIIEALKKHRDIQSCIPKVDYIFFYGSGCKEDKPRKMIEESLQTIFPKALISIRHDLAGAALASCGNQAGIVCILGTGSIACFYDGKEVVKMIGGMGYILGDESAGSYYGRRLLRDYFYGLLPQTIHESMEREFNLDRGHVLNRIYKQDMPNTYLASFMKYIFEHQNEQYIQILLRNGIIEFVDTHIYHFKNFQTVPVHFIGSIAFYFQDTLHKIAEEKHFKIGQIIQKPIDGLVDYFS